jgi:glycosyltransferase involved in cell wall biosynthesis
MISFVVPTYNEENNIIQLIENLNDIAKGLDYEIIICDNGSTDNTVYIAELLCQPVVIIVSPYVTIGALRNLGVKKAKGDILVFLDADMRLTPQWRNNLHTDTITDNMITGSEPSIPMNPTWIEECWYKVHENEGIANTMSTGHMIIRKSWFNTIGGFDETLEVGEDLDISIRARQKDGIIYNNPSLKAIHLGFPKTLYDFFMNQRWYGRNIDALPNKVLGMLIGNLFALVVIIVLSTVNRTFLLLYFVGVVLLSLLLGKARTKRISLRGTLLGGVYIVARTFGIFDTIVKSRRKKGTRRRNDL